MTEQREREREEALGKLLEELVEIIANPPPSPTKEELVALAAKLNHLRESVYYMLFKSGIGGECHAFIEFCGMMAVYTDICSDAARAGVDFRFSNTHSGKALKMDVLNGKYLGEKFDCIFGPTLRANPPAARAFLQELGFSNTSFVKAIGLTNKLDLACGGCGMLQSGCTEDRKLRGAPKCCPTCEHKLHFKQPTKKAKTDEE